MSKFIVLILSCICLTANAAELKVGDDAPKFQIKTHEGKDFSLEDRKGHWTILYFYPKAETPGCTKQACAFRDAINKVKELNAEVYGISTDSVEEIKKFHEHHGLKFTLLADPELKAVEPYGAKKFALKMANRWTFIVGPDMKIKYIDQKVDPVMDVERTTKTIKELQAKSAPR
ncbi:MAG: peroxiredoxin [Bdellovibrionia bacterium]